MLYHIKVPRRLKVGGHVLGIVLNKEDLEDRHLNGSLNTRLGIITINSTRPTSQMVEAWLHEVIHSVNNVFINGERLTEDQVNGLSEGLFQVFTDIGIVFDLSDLEEIQE